MHSILSPIGSWRSNFVVPSKGKRSLKRKRKDTEAKQTDSVPPAPEISSFIEVGLNSVTRKLETLTKESAPEEDDVRHNPSSKATSNVSHAQADNHTGEGKAQENNSTKQNVLQNPFAAVFVLRPSQPTVLHAHLPQLIVTSTFSVPSLPAPRLVELPSGCGPRLSEALGLARVSFIGLREGAPNSHQLIDLVRRVVPEVKIPWLQEAKKAAYLPVKINAIKTTIGSANKAGTGASKKAT